MIDPRLTPEEREEMARDFRTRKLYEGTKSVPGLSLRELSQREGVSYTTIRKRIVRAGGKLRDGRKESPAVAVKRKKAKAAQLKKQLKALGVS